MAVGVHHAAAAPADGLQPGISSRTVKIPGIHVPGEIHVAVDEEAVPLDGNMADGGLPLLVVVGVGGEIERDSLFVQGHPGQRQLSSR